MAPHTIGRIVIGMTNCLECKGTGKVKVSDNTSSINPLKIKCWYFSRCKICNGTGKV